MAGRARVPLELWLLKSCRWVPVQLLQLFFISLGLITQLVKDTSSRASSCVFEVAPCMDPQSHCRLCGLCRLCRHVRVGWIGEMSGWCTSVPNVSLKQSTAWTQKLEVKTALIIYTLPKHPRLQRNHYLWVWKTQSSLMIQFSFSHTPELSDWILPVLARNNNQHCGVAQRSRGWHWAAFRSGGMGRGQRRCLCNLSQAAQLLGEVCWRQFQTSGLRNSCDLLIYIIEIPPWNCLQRKLSIWANKTARKDVVLRYMEVRSPISLSMC